MTRADLVADRGVNLDFVEQGARHVP